MWTLPEDDHGFSKRWGLIKARFSKRVRHLPQFGDGAIWQKRFWEHLVRNDDDFQKHMDYIHFNPVKHGLVKEIKDWPYSSFHRYVQQGIYPEGWGGLYKESDTDFGEPK